MIYAWNRNSTAVNFEANHIWGTKNQGHVLQQPRLVFFFNLAWRM